MSNTDQLDLVNILKSANLKFEKHSRSDFVSSTITPELFERLSSHPGLEGPSFSTQLDHDPVQNVHSIYFSGPSALKFLYEHGIDFSDGGSYLSQPQSLDIEGLGTQIQRIGNEFVGISGEGATQLHQLLKAASARHGQIPEMSDGSFMFNLKDVTTISSKNEAARNILQKITTSLQMSTARGL